MRASILPSRSRPTSLSGTRTPVRTSWRRLAITDGLGAFGGVTTLAGLAGLADAATDGGLLVLIGLVGVGVGVGGRRAFQRAQRPAPGKILSGLAIVWFVLVVAGTITYLITGTIDRVDDAVVESAAGFSTTALTTLDPAELSLPMQLWRGATQWIGGLLGVLAGAVALPMALGQTVLNPLDGGARRDRLVPSPIGGRRRIIGLYLTFTIACGLAYRAVGMGTRDSIVHAFTTVSTGGFSTRADSFASFGGGPRIVATAAMITAGVSFFVLWWIARGRTRHLLRSVELRSYLSMIAVGTLLVVINVDGISLGDALFTVASAASTTGFGIGDWTVFPSASLFVLIVIVATGSMASSAGGGLRVLRARVLVGFASRELRRQLDPHAVVVVKHGADAVEERTLERMTGYQIAHLGLCAGGAFMLAAAGLGVLDSIWGSISAISTFGPGTATGPFGQLAELDAPARLSLVPLMLAGRLSVLPVLVGLVWLVRIEAQMERRVRRLLTRDRS